MLLPTNEDYRWVHDQHEKWDNITKEKLRHLDQIIDGHLDWYSTHKTASDIIRTRRALPDPSLASKRPRKRKLSEVEEAPPIVENVFVDENILTNKPDKDEEHEKEENSDRNQEYDKTDLNKDDNNTTDNLKNTDKDIMNKEDDNASPALQVNVSPSTSSEHPEHNSPKHRDIKVVSSVRIRPTILESLDQPEKPANPGFISRLLNINKKPSLSSTPLPPPPPPPSPPAKEAAQISNTNVDQSNHAQTVKTTETVETMVETQNNASKDTVEIGYIKPVVGEYDIVVSEVIPEPRHRFQKKKSKTKEKEIEQLKDTVKEGITTTSNTTAKTKVITEINDEDVEEEEKKSSGEKETPAKVAPAIPAWACNPELEKLLTRQRHLDPERIFGPITPIDLKTIFKKKSNKLKERQ